MQLRSSQLCVAVRLVAEFLLLLMINTDTDIQDNNINTPEAKKELNIIVLPLTYLHNVRRHLCYKSR